MKEKTFTNFDSPINQLEYQSMEILKQTASDEKLKNKIPPMNTKL
jgi:hypothetical protein